MDLAIADKKALVLASSSGLGLGTAKALAAEGAHVVITGRSEDKLQAAAAAINAVGPGRADILVLDFSGPDAVEAMVDGALSRIGSVDILVNNTGGPPPGKITDVDAATWDRQFDAMVRNLFALTGALLPAMRERGWGRILTIASSGVLEPLPNLGISNALRAAIVGWSKTLANEVAVDGVTVNVLAPGRIGTARLEKLDAANAERTGRTVEAVAEASRQTIPAGRYGTVEEFGAVAAFLCGGPASYVTGSVLRCDGGAVRSV